MNRKWLFLLAVTALAAAVAFGVTRYGASCSRGSCLDRVRDVSYLVRELNLSDVQAREVEALHVELGRQLDDCCTRHCAARGRLGRILAVETNSSAEAEALIAEMSRAYEESERAVCAHIRTVMEKLTPGQKQRFAELISDNLCGSASMTSCSMPTAVEPGAAGETNHGKDGR